MNLARLTLGSWELKILKSFELVRGLFRDQFRAFKDTDKQASNSWFESFPPLHCTYEIRDRAVGYTCSRERARIETAALFSSARGFESGECHLYSAFFHRDCRVLSLERKCTFDVCFHCRSLAATKRKCPWSPPSTPVPVARNNTLCNASTQVPTDTGTPWSKRCRSDFSENQSVSTRHASRAREEEEEEEEEKRTTVRNRVSLSFDIECKGERRENGFLLNCSNNCNCTLDVVKTKRKKERWNGNK